MQSFLFPSDPNTDREATVSSKENGLRARIQGKSTWNLVIAVINNRWNILIGD